MSHVTLVRPPLLVSRNTLQGPLTPPVGPAYLAGSILEAGQDVTIVDAVGEAPSRVTAQFDGSMLATGLLLPEIVERIPEHTDLIGLSAMFSGEWPYIRTLIEQIKVRFPSVPIVGGGEHFTACPEVILESCPEVDFCALGEGEETIVDLLHQVSNGRSFQDVPGIVMRDGVEIARTDPRSRIRGIDEISQPAWHLVPIANYLDQELGYGVNRGRSMPIVATRGCPYQCTFCSSPTMWTTRWLARRPELVIEEIHEYMNRYDATNIDFYDLTAIIKKEWISEFCGQVLDRGMKFTWQLPSGTRSEAIDEEVSQLLYESGCRNLSYAPESGSEERLKEIKKKVDLKRMIVSMRTSCLWQPTRM